jgi:hypothetical protein
MKTISKSLFFLVLVLLSVLVSASIKDKPAVWNVYRNTANNVCTCQQPEERPLLGTLLKGPFNTKKEAQDWACDSDDCEQVKGRDCK